MVSGGLSLWISLDSGFHLNMLHKCALLELPVPAVSGQVFGWFPEQVVLCSEGLILTMRTCKNIIVVF